MYPFNALLLFKIKINRKNILKCKDSIVKTTWTLYLNIIIESNFIFKSFLPFNVKKKAQVKFVLLDFKEDILTIKIKRFIYMLILPRFPLIKIVIKAKRYN